jgi:hypothetical protein
LIIAVSLFAVWQLCPVNAGTYLYLGRGEWPQGAVLFTPGVHAAEAGWLDDVPSVPARRLGWVAAAGLAALLAEMLALVLAREADQALVMGADWPTILLAVLDGVIAVTGTLLVHRLDAGPVAHPWPAARQGSRASYAA